jgi:hypothetical protein
MIESTRFSWSRGIALAASLTSLVFSSAVIAQISKTKPAIDVPAIVLIEPMVETALPIQVGPADAVPRNCFLRVKGLPAQAAFSDGHFVSQGTWALPLAGLDALKLTLPISASGRNELQLTLVAIDGTVLAEAKVTLAVTAGAPVSPGIVLAPPSAARPPSSASLGPTAVDLAQPTPSRPALQRSPPATEPAASAPMKPEDRERAMKLLARGDAEFTGGDVAAARLLYQRAADAGLPDAAIAMGGTFDPAELARRKVKGLVGEPEVARKWYERARALGAPGAEDRLRRVSAP